MPKRHRVPAMPVREVERAPLCSRCKSECEKFPLTGEWHCPECADAWLQAHVEGKVGGHSVGGVELPKGVRDERRTTPSFRDIKLNRAQRRAAQREARHA